jgi:hypothetical protein
MNQLFVQTEQGSKMSDGLIEAMWETLVALAVAAAICAGIISLSAHLNEARIARTSVDMAQAAITATPSGPAESAALHLN